MTFMDSYIGWLVLLLMNTSIYCNADEMIYNSTGPKLPANPHNVKAVQVGNSDVLVTWEMSESQRIQNLTHRVFYAPVEDGDKWKTFDVSGSTATIIGSLSQDETYTIRVSSVSHLGQGPMSFPVTVTIRHLDDCLQCKSKKETNFHCNCSYEIFEETCRDACQFKCSNAEGFDPAEGCKNGCITGWYGQYCNMSCPGMCGEYLISLDVRQIGAQDVLIQWDKLNLTDIELESVKRLVLNHKVSGSTTADAHDVPDWKTRTHYFLQEVDMNSKHTFQLLVLFELQSQSPVISKPVEFELVPRAPDESMLRLTADMKIYATGIWFYKQNSVYRKFAVTDNKTLTWIMAHF